MKVPEFVDILIRNLLRLINEFRWRSFLSRLPSREVVIVIVIPGLEHLSVPCVRLLSPFYKVIIVANGQNKESIAWLHGLLPNIQTFRIYTSIQGKYVMSHGDALDLLARAPYDIVFVDPDCYIFEPALLREMFFQLNSNAVVSLFADHREILGFKVPDTFCFGVQSRSFSVLRKLFAIRIGVTYQLAPRLLVAAFKRWGDPVPFPHPEKLYYDTIHAFAIASYISGMGICIVQPSEGDAYHVCGTSYASKHLHQYGELVDQVAINALYFHSLVVESLSSPLPAQDIDSLVKRYGGAKGVLEKFPFYAVSEERKLADELFQSLADRSVLFS
jgi:hypothetical protein